MHPCSECKLSDSAGEILERLGEVKGELRGVNQRLDVLNGSVARHQKSINDLENHEAERRGVISAVKFVSPALWAVAGIAALLALQNAPKVLAAIGATK